MRGQVCELNYNRYFNPLILSNLRIVNFLTHFIRPVILLVHPAIFFRTHTTMPSLRGSLASKPSSLTLAALSCLLSSTAPIWAAAPSNIALSSGVVGPTLAPGSTIGIFTTTDADVGDNHLYELVPGVGSTHNGLFTVSGLDNEILSNIGSLAGFLDQTLSIRVRTTDSTAATFEKVLTISVTDDSDADGLLDVWELTYFPSLGSATISGNNDGDTLTNGQEFTKGTNPALTDTDGDTLADHVENGSGTFVNASNPGTNPTNADSDGDGLRDDAEILATSGFATNPNLADTDADTFSDSVELSAGTNPLLFSSKPTGLLPLRINEVLVRNSLADLTPGALSDAAGRKQSWIEIFNPNATAVNLDFWYLTDSATNLQKWNFPNISIAANNYITVFASGLDFLETGVTGRAHTNFNLDADGEYLALVRPDGVISSAFAPAFPKQFRNVSYGIRPTDGTLRYFSPPTPGTPPTNTTAVNGTGFEGVVEDTAFSVKRGFYDAPFSLAITTLTPSATIRYTIDGTKPTDTTGIVYTTPISITGTTTVRAAAFRSGWISTNVDTSTYLFLNQVMTQPALPTFPPGAATTLLSDDWGFNANVDSQDGTGRGALNGIVPADYAMDQRVVNGTLSQPVGQGPAAMREALLSIPTINISLPIADFFGPSDAQKALPTPPADLGLWSTTSLPPPGNVFPKECSAEMIIPNGASGNSAWQENCTVEIHGNSSRNPGRMQKHSLRLTFTSTLGAGSLNYPLFANSPVSSFNKLVLRACFTDSWAGASWAFGRYRPNDAQYLRDFYMKELYRTMGQSSSYGAYSHVYVNGIYMGLYNHTERVEDDWFVEHFGGVKTDWDIFGDFTSPSTGWQATVAKTAYSALATDIDLNNFADYLLLHEFADVEDWPHHNGYAARNTVLGSPWRFYVWDQEIGFDNHDLDLDRLNGNTGIETQGGGTGTGIGFLTQKLRSYDEFRLLFADRARKHLYNGGALSAPKAAAEYLRVANIIDKAILAESARWGDTRASLPYGSTFNFMTVSNPPTATELNNDAYPPPPNGTAAAPSTVCFTRHQSWIPERDNIINNYIPGRHNTANNFATVNMLRNMADSTATASVNFQGSLYPSTAANPPDFNQHGGNVASGFNLTMTVASPSTGGTIYFTTNGTDPRVPGTGVVNTGTTATPVTNGTPRSGVGVYTAAIPLTQTSTIKARYRSPANEWSALTEAQFIVGTAAAAGSLVITKIHFNPASLGEAEFVELMNISANPIDLTGVQFQETTQGIQYSFPAATILAPGARIVVTGLQFTGRLSNGGEELTLLAANGSVIQRFSYGATAPWPGGTSGGGFALVLINPEANPDPSNAANWRASVDLGGQPGVSDTVAFSGNPTADFDKDGLTALQEYALGTSDLSPVSFTTGIPAVESITTPANGIQPTLAMNISHARATDDAAMSVEFSPNLSTWVPGVLVRRRSDNLETWRAPDNMAGVVRGYARLKVVSQ